MSKTALSKPRLAHALVAIALATLGLACTASSDPAGAPSRETAPVLDAKAIAALPAGASFVLEPGTRYELGTSSGPIDATRVAVRSATGAAIPVGDRLQTATASSLGSGATRTSEAVRYCVMCGQVCDPECGEIYCEVFPCSGGSSGGALQ
jgi:hypothetical protein